jgi:hypothetical protein
MPIGNMEPDIDTDRFIVKIRNIDSQPGEMPDCASPLKG